MTHHPKRPRRPAPGILPVALGVATLLVLLAGLAVALGRGTTPPRAAAPQAVDGCRTTPQFVAAVASSPTMALATDGRELGLVLRSPAGDAPAYQHPTWDDAGYLGAIAYDAQGNVYAAPTPRLSLMDNPLAGAATLWRADTATGALRPFVTLPGVASAQPLRGGEVGAAPACNAVGGYRNVCGTY